MKIIGVTGNLGAGKDLVADYIAKHYGLKHLDADKIGKQVLEKNKHKLSRFGPDIVMDGTINVENLFNSIFGYEDVIRDYNNWILPLVVEEIGRQLMDLVDEKYVVLSAALLFEARVPADYIILVRNSLRNVLRKRIKDRCEERGIPHRRVRRLAALQFPDDLKLFYSHFIVDNNAEIKYAEEQVQEIMKEILYGGK